MSLFAHGRICFISNNTSVVCCISFTCSNMFYGLLNSYFSWMLVNCISGLFAVRSEGLCHDYQGQEESEARGSPSFIPAEMARLGLGKGPTLKLSLQSQSPSPLLLSSEIDMAAPRSHCVKENAPTLPVC